MLTGPQEESKSSLPEHRELLSLINPLGWAVNKKEGLTPSLTLSVRISTRWPVGDTWPTTRLVHPVLVGHIHTWFAYTYWLYPHSCYKAEVSSCNRPNGSQSEKYSLSDILPKCMLTSPRKERRKAELTRQNIWSVQTKAFYNLFHRNDFSFS